MVAAAAYPGGDDDYAMQFTDTSFLITQLLQLTGGAPGSDPLVGAVDPARVGVAGHSNGEAIAYGMGFLQCCRDTRVKSVIALAGNLGNINNPVQRDNGVPILRNDHLPGNETQGSSNVCCSIYAVRLNEIDGMHGLYGGASAGFRVEEIGTVQNKDAERIRVKWYCGSALKSTKSLARLKGITNI